MAFTRASHAMTRKASNHDRYVLHFEVTDPDAADWWDDEPRLPEAVTSASERPVLPEAATSGSESNTENLLPEVSDRLPEDTASGTNLLTGRLKPIRTGVIYTQRGVILRAAQAENQNARGHAWSLALDTHKLRNSRECPKRQRAAISHIWWQGSLCL